MPLGYLDDASVSRSLDPLVLFCNDSSEHNVIQFEWVLHCHDFVLQLFIWLREFLVEHSITEEPAACLSHVRDHRVITHSGH